MKVREAIGKLSHMDQDSDVTLVLPGDAVPEKPAEAAAMPKPAFPMFGIVVGLELVTADMTGKLWVVDPGTAQAWPVEFGPFPDSETEE